MNTQRWTQIEDIFHAALKCEITERHAYITRACGGDTQLQQEVESLIASFEQPGEFLESVQLNAGLKLYSALRGELQAGEIIGPYTILGRIGQGGMGDVYVARDERLGRQIALKLLPRFLCDDSEWITQFRIEARAASAISHPNIAHIYEVGEFEGHHFIAMEHVEGVTLRELINSGPLKVEQAVDLLRQSAEGIAAAHAVGVFHSDIKPENLMVRFDGYVKVLDFGLAKIEVRSLQAPENSQHYLNETSSTVIRGTPRYMSPEQAVGAKADARSDIWSLGVVLYEMLCGEPPFTGNSASEILERVRGTKPSRLAEDDRHLSSALKEILRKALNKNNDSRYQTVTALLHDLRFCSPQSSSELASRESFDPLAHHVLVERRMKSTIRKKFVTLGVAFAVVLVFVTLGYRWRATTDAQKTFQQIKTSIPTSPLPQQIKLAAVTSGGTWAPGISPDGLLVGYTANDANMQESLWIKEIATGHSRQLVPADGGRFSVVTFSRDGQHLYYVWGDPHNDSQYLFGDIYRIPVNGGAPDKLFSHISGFFPSPDEKRFVLIRVDLPGQKYQVRITNADGTGERIVSEQKWPRMTWLPSWSPDASLLTYCVRNSGPDGFYNTVMAVPAEGGPERPLTTSKWMDVGFAIWLPDGSGMLITGREHAGDPFQIYEISYPGGEVRRLTNDLNSYSYLGITADSRKLIAEVDDLKSNIWIVKNGDTSKAQQITYGGKDGVGGISWTTDGRVVFATISRDSYNMTGASGDKALWIMNADGQNRKQLTFDGMNSNPAVAPDGRYIVFSAYRGGVWGIWRMNIDASEPTLLASGGVMTNPACSPDGQWIFFRRLGSSSQPTICRVSINGGDVVEISDQNALAPSISPDGKLLAFFSEEDSGSVLRVIPSTGTGKGKAMNLSPDNEYLGFPNVARWTPDGGLLTYPDSKRHVSNIYGIPVNGGPIRQLTHFNADLIFSFAWSFDGYRLAVARGQWTRQVVLLTDFNQTNN